ncbi:ABC transporter substrate-binding protein [Paracoccus tibetensis]|uniref:Iron(III) transport system substrate-binding protein n=1 Tax=Paracoccus tibetensis TaxID=336292 RepID=A0A1G5IAJ1_9RHOB|nr:ABC transporter substrate-binding protein [Paracoccus tibetensis]SCY72338.1 iron(III) transport system substrate-binding protein [Paracoccus tibetensis]
MRHAVIAAALTLLHLAPAAGFEIESESIFGDESAPRIEVLSTTDTAAFAPVLTAFVARHPGRAIRYVQASSSEIQRAVAEEGAQFDLVISSAMDMQMKLVNDGFAASVELAAPGLPAWARWRDQLWGIALEPVVTLASRSAFADLPLPVNRRELIATLRENADRFQGRIATYDPQVSGVGYFLTAQDDQVSDGFWRLAEVMGRLDARLYCCSSDMIDDLRSGDLAVVYNVVASYAARFRPDDPDLVRIAAEDYTFAIVRSAFLPAGAPDPEGGRELLLFLLSGPAQRLIAETSGVALVPGTGPAPAPQLRPIRLDAGLLVYGDRLRRAGLLAEWQAALNQR